MPQHDMTNHRATPIDACSQQLRKMMARCAASLTVGRGSVVGLSGRRRLCHDNVRAPKRKLLPS
jgi:hypothetical protein